MKDIVQLYTYHWINWRTDIFGTPLVFCHKKGMLIPRSSRGFAWFCYTAIPIIFGIPTWCSSSMSGLIIIAQLYIIIGYKGVKSQLMQVITMNTHYLQNPRSTHNQHRSTIKIHRNQFDISTLNIRLAAKCQGDGGHA